MWSEIREGWRERAFWRAWWRNDVERESKVAIGVCAAVAIAAVGYLSAEALSTRTQNASQAVRVVTVRHRVVQTVVRQTTVVRSRAVTQPVTVVRTVDRAVPGPTRTVVQQVPGQARTVVRQVQVPGPTRTVVQQRAAVPLTVTREVTAPPETVTNVVTTTLPAVTVTVTVRQK